MQFTKTKTGWRVHDGDFFVGDIVWERTWQQYVLRPTAWHQPFWTFETLNEVTDFLQENSYASLRPAFDYCAMQWIKETCFLSSVQTTMANAYFTRMVELGEPAVQFALERMLNNDDLCHWFLLTHAITGLDPAAGEETVQGAEDRWIEWGQAEGYLV